MDIDTIKRHISEDIIDTILFHQKESSKKHIPDKCNIVIVNDGKEEELIIYL